MQSPSDKFTVDHFISGDEVYLVGGNGEPFGMVDRLGSVNVLVRPHNQSKSIAIKPTKLYLGAEWHQFNKR